MQNKGPDYIERIKELKSSRKMTTENLSRLSGVPVGTLSKMLAGVSDSVKLSNIVAVCDALGVSLDFVVSGIPENTNNFTLDGEEIRLIEDYRRLDRYGRELVAAVISKERERRAEAAGVPETAVKAGRGSVILTSPAANRYRDGDAIRRAKRLIPLCELPVSAGPGEFLDGSLPASEKISVASGEITDRADYAVRISGSSMMPKSRDGDILLVEDTDAVEVGEPCIFVLDGSGYFKIFGGDCLISLNPEYGRIMLRDFENVYCSGRVIGKLKKKN